MLIRLTAATIVASTVGVGAVVWKQRTATRGVSQIITERWDGVGGDLWLKPGLRDALVVMPDRPHPPAGGGRSNLPVTRTRSALLNTNSRRLRGTREIGPTAPDVIRIIALGDSVSHGWGVDDHEAYPARLEDHLDRFGRAVEVLNAGCPSAGPTAMARWCRDQAPTLDPDLLLWTRRPPPGAGAVPGFAREVAGCQLALGAPVVVVLSPLSTFDRRSARSAEEAREVASALQPHGIAVHDLTPALLAAQEGRGEVLVEREGRLQVVDQDSGRVWLDLPAPGRGRLPEEIYALFEREPDVREALFFDGAHPNAEGFAVMAEQVAEWVSPMIDG